VSTTAFDPGLCENILVDTFVDALDLAELGFDGVAPTATGRPAYHPSVL
jgi:hypothetical protein